MVLHPDASFCLRHWPCRVDAPLSAIVRLPVSSRHLCCNECRCLPCLSLRPWSCPCQPARSADHVGPDHPAIVFRKLARSLMLFSSFFSISVASVLSIVPAARSVLDLCFSLSLYLGFLLQINVHELTLDCTFFAGLGHAHELATWSPPHGPMESAALHESKPCVHLRIGGMSIPY